MYPPASYGCPAPLARELGRQPVIVKRHVLREDPANLVPHFRLLAPVVDESCPSHDPHREEKGEHEGSRAHTPTTLAPGA